jgi:hypothetical protein
MARADRPEKASVNMVSVSDALRMRERLASSVAATGRRLITDALEDSSRSERSSHLALSHQDVAIGEAAHGVATDGDLENAATL